MYPRWTPPAPDQIYQTIDLRHLWYPIFWVPPSLLVHAYLLPDCHCIAVSFAHRIEGSRQRFRVL